MSSIGSAINGVLMGVALASDPSNAANQAQAQRVAAEEQSRRRRAEAEAEAKRSQAERTGRQY